VAEQQTRALHQISFREAKLTDARLRAGDTRRIRPFIRVMGVRMPVADIASVLEVRSNETS
jgi:hypothetical protein